MVLTIGNVKYQKGNSRIGQASAFGQKNVLGKNGFFRTDDEGFCIEPGLEVWRKLPDHLQKRTSE